MSSSESQSTLLMWTAVRRMVCVIGLLAAAGTFAYSRLYSSFAPYDDEGYIQLSLQMYRTHGGLYDRVVSQYGPAYYLLSDGLHSTLQWPVTHDVARLKTLLCWLAACGLAGCVVLRMTSQLWVAVLAAVGVLFHLDRFGWEPGHPQEFAVLLVLGALWTASQLDTAAPASQNRWFAVLGLLAGTLAAIKLNLGGLLGIAVVAAMLLSLPSQRWARWLWHVLAVIGLLLPLALSKSHIVSLSGAALPAAVMAGWIGVWIRRTDVQDGAVTRGGRQLGMFVVAGGLTAGTWSAGALLTGTSWKGLWHGLVGQHGKFLNLFYHDAPLPEWSLVLCFLSVYIAWGMRRDPRVSSIARWAAVGALGLVGLRVCGETWQPIRHGLADRGAAGMLAAVVPPFAWLLLTAPRDACDAQGARGDERGFARRVLAMLAVTQPLGAIPTPGTQMAVGTLPALLLLFVLAGDLLSEWNLTTVHARDRLRWCCTALCVLAVATLGCRVIEGFRCWRAAESLGLHGAEWMRLPSDEAQHYRRTVACLQSHADQFVASPTGLCSLYLWSGMSPPTTFNATYWEALLSAEQQTEVAAALAAAQHPRLVVQRDQGSVVLRDAPLHRYLQSRFTRLELDGPLQVWAPAEQPAVTRNQFASRTLE